VQICAVIGSPESSAAPALSCRIPSHASVGKCPRENVQGECPFPGAVSVLRCTGVVDRNRRRSTSCITPTTVECVVAGCTQFITY